LIAQNLAYLDNLNDAWNKQNLSTTIIPDGILSCNGNALECAYGNDLSTNVGGVTVPCTTGFCGNGDSSTGAMTVDCGGVVCGNHDTSGLYEMAVQNLV